MIWKGWQKKMLWFVLFFVIMDFDQYINYITNIGDGGITLSLTWIIIGIIPLFFLKDDEVLR